jgi:CBS domain-containing protein
MSTRQETMYTLTLRSIKERELQIPGTDPWHADLTDPALSIMTDFRERTSVTIGESASIDAALEHMKHTGVRCAFVTNDARRVVVGLITAYDITSEKPMRHIRSVDGKREDVLVRDIMQAIGDWRVADIKDVERLTVAAVARMFEETRLTHLPVMEGSASGGYRLRGLLSSARLKRLLATPKPGS